jgi:hypothetical protein
LILERDLAVGIRHTQAIELGERDGLNDVETTFFAVVKIARGLLEGEPVEEFPTRVSEPKKRCSVLVLEVVAIGRRLHRAVLPRLSIKPRQTKKQEKRKESHRIEGK